MMRRTLWGYAPPTRLSGRSTRIHARRPGWIRCEEEGAIAYTYGVPVTRNPYYRQDDRKLWNRGWHRARMKAQRGKR